MSGRLIAHVGGIVVVKTVDPEHDNHLIRISTVANFVRRQTEPIFNFSLCDKHGFLYM
jgi:hypothetical protein